MGKVIVGETSGAEYEILKELGRGAQGRVYSIQGGKYAFKQLGKKTSSKAQLLKRKISYIKTRSIKDLPISRPLEQVKGNVLGYIMEMASDMESLEELLKPKGDNWWKETGGLKKRLLILVKLSKVLSDLHSRGLVYGDLSPSNIFISEDPNYSEVFLIDCDNITHESKVGEAVYTPGYGAPEIVKQDSGSDTYSDDFSFAIIAYQLLTLNHPFIGDYVNNGEPELEEQAYLGEIPWVNHSEDNLNRTTTGMASLITISSKMMQEFEQTFESGIKNCHKRTTTLKWYETIDSALNFVLQCESCGNYHFFSKKRICPFCNNKLDFVGIVSIYQFISPLKKQISDQFNVQLNDVEGIGKELLSKVIQPNEYLVITENDLLLNASYGELYKIKVAENHILIKGINQKKITMWLKGKNKLKDIDITQERRINFNKIESNNLLFLSQNPNSDYQRVIKIRKSGK